MLILLPLDYIIKGHCGNIIQDVGCSTATYNATLSFPLFWMWPCVLFLVAITYGMLSFRAFLKRQITAEEFLDCNASGFNADRYFRLMCFSCVELTVAFPRGLYEPLIQAVDKPVYPWISWENTQSDFDRFDQLPAIFITSSSINTLQFGIMLWARSLPFLPLLPLLRTRIRSGQPV